LIIDNIDGVPKFVVSEFEKKKMKYCLCIPIINENGRIHSELARSKFHGIDKLVDIIICDGGSNDGSTDKDLMSKYNVNTLLTKSDIGKLGAQLRMGFWWALNRGYSGIITIDGNDKDSIESVPLFIRKLDEGYDFVQGSRFILGGNAINTPLERHLAVKYIHAPLTSYVSNYHYTDSTNGFRAHSKRFLEHPEVKPFRGIFQSYELLPFLSIIAPQLNLRICEVPVTRTYPKSGLIPTKITKFSDKLSLLAILIKAIRGDYHIND